MRHIWIITRCFPPRSNIAAKRFAALTPHLESLSWKPWVISVEDINYKLGQAPGGLENPLGESQVYRIIKAAPSNTEASPSAMSGVLRGLRSLIGRFALTPIGQALLHGKWRLYTPGYWFDEFGIADPDKTVSDCLSQGFAPPDAVLCSVPPGGALLLGRKVSGHFHCPLVADFRDLQALRDDRFELVQRIDRWLESRLLATTAGVVAISPYLTEASRKAYGKPSETIYNGYTNLETQPSRFEESGSYFYYAGMIYPHQMPAVRMFLSTFQQHQSSTGFTLKWRLLPSAGGVVEQITQLVRELGLESSAHLLPPTDSVTVGAEARGAYCNLVFEDLSTEYQYSRGTLTGKLLELINYLPPVLAVARADSDIGQVLHEAQAGVLASEAQGLADALERIARWERQATIAPGFSDLARAKQLVSFIESIAG